MKHDKRMGDNPPSTPIAPVLPPTAWRGAANDTQELGGWRPPLRSPDAASLWEWEDLSARVQDLQRSNGFVRGSRQSLQDNLIGSGWRLSAKPDAAALGIEFDEAVDLGRRIEVAWRNFVLHPGRYLDAARRYDFNGMLCQAFWSWFNYGEVLAVGLMEDRGGPFRTAIQNIDPARLSNPNRSMDRVDLRRGVELGPRGEPLAYHIQNQHPYDHWAGRDGFTWKRVPRWVEGFPARLQVIHAVPAEGIDQTRGVSPLSTIIEAAKLEERMSRAELMAAVISAGYALSIESPYDADSVAAALGAGGGDGIGDYHANRADFHNERRYSFAGSPIPILYPGEKMNFHQPGHPNQSYAAFESTVLRHMAAGAGLSYEQVSRDFSKTNYSSARASLMEAWKFITGRKSFFSGGYAGPIYLLWLEEALLDGHVEPPSGAPEFHEAMAAYARCEWIGPGRGWIDPVKEAQASGLRISGGISTLEHEAAEQGRDWEEIAEQRARERARLAELDIEETDMRAVQPMAPEVASTP